jgi:hypothetical protein
LGLAAVSLWARTSALVGGKKQADIARMDILCLDGALFSFHFPVRLLRVLVAVVLRTRLTLRLKGSKKKSKKLDEDRILIVEADSLLYKH